MAPFEQPPHRMALQDADMAAAPADELEVAVMKRTFGEMAQRPLAVAGAVGGMLWHGACRSADRAEIVRKERGLRADMRQIFLPPELAAAQALGEMPRKLLDRTRATSLVGMLELGEQDRCRARKRDLQVQRERILIEVSHVAQWNKRGTYSQCPAAK